jgi:hypothetical protein
MPAYARVTDTLVLNTLSAVSTAIKGVWVIYNELLNGAVITRLVYGVFKSQRLAHAACRLLGPTVSPICVYWSKQLANWYQIVYKGGAAA